MFLSSCNWYQSLNKNEFFDNDGDHADEMETSLMLYFNPELVLPLDEAGEGKEKKICIEGFSEGWAWTERKWSMVTEDTGIGNPKLATSEKGKRYFNAAAQKLSKLFIEICEIQIDQLYK